jgi:hypothetical protein
MRGWAVSFAALALVIGGCAAKAPNDPSGSTIPPPVAASPSVVASTSAGPSPSGGPPSFCPGRTWPPYRLGGIPGITADSRDRATIEISNQSGRTYYYRVAGWQLARFETCRAFGEEEVERGPIAAGATVRVMLTGNLEQNDVPLTIAFWDQPCGESCEREPVAAMLVVRSPLEPPAS